MFEWFHWRDLAPHALWAAIWGVGIFAWTRVRAWIRARGQGAILSGLDGPTVLVFPPYPPVTKRPLSRMAIEDFLAINNLISAFMLTGRKTPFKIRDVDHLTEADKNENNLILICSSKCNSATKSALAQLRKGNAQLENSIPQFEDVPGKPDQLQIRWNKALFLSDSYEQEEAGSSRLDDIAVILKGRSPWSERHKILVVAGIRGIGTWGAAECLKKWWSDLYSRKDQSRSRGTAKVGDFVAVISVHYEDHDIKGVKLLQLVDLEQAYSKR